MGVAPARLALSAVTRSFGPLVAVAPLTIELAGGGIHGLLGENGAGKSTLVRMIAGELRPDAGTVAVDGQVLPPGEPRAARAAGVGVVHQHFALIGALSVAENLLLGRPEVASSVVWPHRLVADAKALARRHSLEIGDPRRRCDSLPVGTQARVEILRALSGAPKLLLLDEPTAVLTPAETTDLFATLRGLSAAGLLVVFITHKLDEALALCDTVSVMRAGRLIATLPAREASAGRLANLMVGTGGTPAAETTPGEATDDETGSRRGGDGLLPARTALAVREVATADSATRVALDRVTFSVGAGEICGIAGVDGNGQEELAAALCGLGGRSGTVTVDGNGLPSGDVAAAQRAGVAIIPPDRRRDGLAPALAVWENALLAAPLLRRFAPRGVLDVAGARSFARALASDYRLALTDVEQPLSTLSGGNQQRLVVGRALAMRPTVLIAVNPTRGLDIAATAQVHALLRQAARSGSAVLLISTDLDELTSTCGRIFALFRGRLAGPVTAAEREELGAMIAGLTPRRPQGMAGAEGDG